jgi:integrase
MIKTVRRVEGVRYQVYGRRAGRDKKVYVGSYASKREAIAIDEDFRTTQRKIVSGELPSDVDIERTFSVAAEAWIKALREAGSRSWDEYESRVRNHLAVEFGSVPIVKIRKLEVVRWRDRISATVSASFVNALVGTLSSAFTWFVDQQWIAGNPCHRVKMLVRPAKVFPWLQSLEQVTRLLSECTPNIRTIVAVLVGTGMRLDEALHLHWDDIDLEHRLIAVHRGRRGMTKSGKLRWVPILDALLPVLREMRLQRGRNVLLWPGGRPGRPLSQPSVWKPFKRAVEHAELDERMRVHDLRHSFASLWLIDGGDIFDLSRILGHSSVTITERTYAHLRPDTFEKDYGRVKFRMPSDMAASPVRLPNSGPRRG